MTQKRPFYFSSKTRQYLISIFERTESQIWPWAGKWATRSDGHCQPRAGPCLSKCSQCSSTISLIQKHIRNAESQAPSLIYWKLRRGWLKRYSKSISSKTWHLTMWKKNSHKWLQYLETVPSLEEGRVMNRHRLLELERISKEKGKCDFRYERFENLKDGQVDVTTLDNVELGAKKKCQDWGFPHGPVARTLNFQCRGPRFYPWSGN